MKKIIRSFFQIFLPLMLGGLTGFFIKNSIDFKILVKPPLTPPAWLYPAAWTILYLLMGISYYLYKKEHEEFSEVEVLYFTQLFFNLTWTIVFFILKWRFFSIVWIILLWLLNLSLISKFFQKKKISAYLLIPYLLWLLFAAYLNIGIYILN